VRGGTVFQPNPRYRVNFVTAPRKAGTGCAPGPKMIGASIRETLVTAAVIKIRE